LAEPEVLDLGVVGDSGRDDNFSPDKKDDAEEELIRAASPERDAV
jgi:hypothetical protein